VPRPPESACPADEHRPQWFEQFPIGGGLCIDWVQFHDRLSDRSRSSSRERVRQGVGDPRSELGCGAAKTNAEQFPEAKQLLDMGLQGIQYTVSSDDLRQADKLYRGASPSNDGTELSTAVMPEGFR